MKESVLRSLRCWLLFLLGIIAAITSVVYPDSIVLRKLRLSDFKKTDAGLAWEFDAETMRLERLPTASSLSSIVFLGGRLIPIRTEYTSWSESNRPWHRVNGGSLLIALAPEQESLLETLPLEIAFLGEYSLVRVWATVVCIGLFACWCWFYPNQFKFVLQHLLHSSFWIAAVLITLVIVIQFGFWTKVLQPVPLQEVQAISGEPIKWFTYAVWGLRRLESSGPGIALILALMLAAIHRRRDHLMEPYDLRSSFVRRSWLIAFAACSLSSLVSIWFGAGIRYAPDLTHYSSPVHSRLIWSDASEYLAGAQNLLFDGSLTAFNQRRPLNASLLSVRYALSLGDRRLCQWIEHGLFATSLGLLLQSVTLRLGAASGLAVFGWVWGFSRWYSATFLSEMLGLSMGCWGVSLLLLADNQTRFVVGALSQKWVHLVTMLLTVTIMTISQLARPGSLFSIPLLGLAASLQLSKRTSETQTLRGRSLRFLGLLGMFAIASVVAIAFQNGLNMTYGDGSSRQGANLSYTIAGMTEGRSWSEVMEVHRSVIESLENESEVASYLYGLAWSNIQKQPAVFVQQLTKACWSFARELPGTLSRTAFPELGRLNSTKGLMAIVCIGALIYWWVNRASLLTYYLLFLLVGLIGSVAIVFLDGSWRVLAASWPLLAICASGCFGETQLDVSSEPLRLPKSIGTLFGCHGVMLLVVVATAWVGPAVAGRIWRANRSTAVPPGPAGIEKPRLGDRFPIPPNVPITEPVFFVNGPTPSMSKRSFLLDLQQSDLETLPTILKLLDVEESYCIRLCFDPRYDSLWWVVRFQTDAPAHTQTNRSRWELAVEPNVVIERED